MSYHVTNLGSFATTVARFADLDGYVPEDGDAAADFRYPCPNDFDDAETWSDWVAEAVEATERAEAELAEWRGHSGGKPQPQGGTMRHYYAFEYTDGTNTTTGGDYGRRLCIAGELVTFESRAARDEFVAAGVDYRHPDRRRFPFRRAVTTRTLPLGWRTEDATRHLEMVEY